MKLPCWLRLRRHRWLFSAYRLWPSEVVEVCVLCGAKRDRMKDTPSW